MKRNSFLTAILLSFLFVLQMKAQQPFRIDPDSVPPAFVALHEEVYNAKAFYPLWYQKMQEIEAKAGDKSLDLYYLYKYRVSYHYEQNELDSMKKYVPMFQELCLRLGDEYQYYNSWDLLCEFMLFSNQEEESIAEQKKMQEDADERKSEMGQAFSTSRIGMAYATRKEYSQARPYFEQSIKMFEHLKCWSEYTMLASNYVIVLLHLGDKKEALSTFLHLDSIADSFLQEKNPEKYVRRVVMIKNMASEVYSELYEGPQDTLILKKYLNEMEELYRRYPNIPISHLYNTKIHYATMTNNLPELIAYQDSLARYSLETDNMVELLHAYYYMSENQAKAHRYKDAYETLHKYVVLNDSIYKEDFQKQLSEMSTRYNVNKLELDAQKARMEARNTQYYYACALIVILAIALLVGFRFYLHKLKSNRLLKKHADELMEANEREQKAQLMKTAFIQNMNHEIRTPLNAIVGFTECLAMIPMEPEEIQEMSATIKKSSDQLLKIISDTIYIANIDSDKSVLNYQSISLHALCSGVILQMQEDVQPGVNLYFTPVEPDYYLMTDEGILTQILTNLLHNALKFTQQGEVEISYQVDESANELRLYVRDTGPGVSSELKEAIFERFYKIDSFVQGAGLGLSLCRVLAERLGARVYLDDSYHDGCLFVLAHPIKQSAS